MHSDYLEIRKNFLSHASIAGMPTNVARRLGYKKVTGDVNTGVGAKEKAKARVDAAEKKLNELQAKIDEYSNALYNAITEVKSLNPIKRAEGFIGLVNSIAGRKDFVNIKKEYEQAMTEYYDAATRYQEIDRLISTYHMNKEFEERRNRANSDYKKQASKSASDFNKYVQETHKEFEKRVADNKAASDDWYAKEVAKMDREYTNRVNAMRNTSKGSTAGMPSNIKKKKR